MPEAFEKCRHEKGKRIVTIKPTANTYRYLCYSHSYPKGTIGELHHNKPPSAEQMQNIKKHTKRKR